MFVCLFVCLLFCFLVIISFYIIAAVVVCLSLLLQFVSCCSDCLLAFVQLMEIFQQQTTANGCFVVVFPLFAVVFKWFGVA